MAQAQYPGAVCYLQPYSTGKIKFLVEKAPSPDTPIDLYLSSTETPNLVSFQAKIVGWTDNTELAKDPAAVETLNEQIAQLGQEPLYFDPGNGNKCVNLIALVDLKRCQSPFSIAWLRKQSNGTPLMDGVKIWSPVYAPPKWVGSLPDLQAINFEEYQQVAASLSGPDEARLQQLAVAPKLPESSFAYTRIFRRNCDVIAQDLKRADGLCENCGSPAPFLRVSDSSPYLEVHHRTMLSKGGEDTVENALAVCPNCHRQLHFGV